MFFRMIPIIPGADMAILSVREPKPDLQSARFNQRRFHPHGNHILILVAVQFHPDRLPFHFVPAFELAGPKVQFLPDVFQVLNTGFRTVAFGENQPDQPQVEPVGVAAQPISRFSGAALLVLRRIRDFPAVAGSKGPGRILQGIVAGIRETMPAPVGFGAQGNAVLVVVRKALQARNIRREGEIPVADRQGFQGVDPGVDHVVPADQRMAVNRSAGCRFFAGRAMDIGKDRAGQYGDDQVPKGHFTRLISTAKPNAGAFPPGWKFFRLRWLSRPALPAEPACLRLPGP